MTNIIQNSLRELESQLQVTEAIEEGLAQLNQQFVNVIERDAFAVGDSFGLADLLPKALLIYMGGRTSFTWKVGASASITFGFALMNDRVDCVNKNDVADLNWAELANAFEEIDRKRSRAGGSSALALVPSFIPLGQYESHIESIRGKSVVVTSTNEIDVAPIMMFSPALGAGLGGGLGAGVRVGVAGIWWRGNHILEPEHLYGFGGALSVDARFAVGGYNFKLGAFNTAAAPGPLNYILGGVAWDIGPSIEAPVSGKLNGIWIESPQRLLAPFAINAEGWIDSIMKSIGQRAFEGIGISNN